MNWIDVKELRAGNLVYSKYFKEIRIVGLIGNGNVLSYEIDKGGLDGTSGIADAEPIPLTREWLVKFGFEFSRMAGGLLIEKYIIGKLRLVIPYSKGALGELELDLRYDVLSINAPKIKYVHQLQNIHFALTGEELIYTP